MNMSSTSPSLLVRLRDGDDSISWDQFVTQYWRLIYSFALQRGLGASEAEDIVQEVLMEIFGAMPEFEYDRSRGTFRGYLRRITQRRITDHVCRCGRSPTLPLDRADGEGMTGTSELAGDDAVAAWERDWRRNLLQVCLKHVANEVEPRTFQAFELFALRGWTVGAVAGLLEMSEASVYAAKSRVARRVREWYDKELSED